MLLLSSATSTRNAALDGVRTRGTSSPSAVGTSIRFASPARVLRKAVPNDDVFITALAPSDASVEICEPEHCSVTAIQGHVGPELRSRAAAAMCAASAADMTTNAAKYRWTSK